MSQIIDVLQKYPGFPGVIVNRKPYKKLDFSASNTDLASRNLTATRDFSDYVHKELLGDGTYIGIGGYLENRVIYRNREHFGKQKAARSIHLGVDIWAKAGEPVYTPLKGIVHSYAFNDQYGDYGPTIILRHHLNGVSFYTLYGHLSLDSVDGLYTGKLFGAGEKIAEIGNFPENGDWPPHLHFQVITDIGNYEGDFPGVCSVQDQDYYRSICPDPNLILRIE
ncbi:hypothetical protein DYBT9275_04573 [Dyadobacter sp. CECT 9275]|uniref:M23ase beta-sheet core domain-containing protein n=1 Tax=Dyadobacter helix TaxID=2822344 RepID=A0A916JFF3_9BACT|nr:peptidoglycan DD-metalloendopeptidase family protein [Dyadobacter sp. CECT 9275]CAG5009806.1 hypothetical protein DYBT9275_04573 [Dyadobacter sp. CECT 9275]